MELWYGGKIYTMKNEGDWVEAVVTKQGTIISTGCTQDLYAAYKKSIKVEHDLKGAVMYPGFTDSHLHIIGHGERLMRLDLSFLKSAEEVLQALRQHAEQLMPGEWIIGDGWNENQWEDKRVIHRKELDQVSSEHPMMLTRVCRHALLANSKAMELAEVTKATEDPQGGVVVKDEEGQPTGYFLDQAQELIKQAMPEVTPEYLSHATELAVRDMHAFGLVGGHSEDLNYYGGFKKTLNAYDKVIDGEKIKFRAHLLVHHEVVEAMDKEGLGFKKGNDFVELGAMKVFADGALGGRTAWLSEDYADDPGNKGVAIHSTEELKNLLLKARERDMPVAVHAIGDAAAEAVIDMIEAHPLKTGERDRLIHAQILNPALIQRLQKLNIILDIQPTFVSSDFPWVIDRLGHIRLKTSYSWKTLLDAGVVCAGGSDAPIEEINPLLGIRAAVDRRSSYDNESYQTEERLSVYEAIALYTTGSAYAIGKEDSQGIISEGYKADFTVLDRDLFQLKPYELAEATVTMTIVDGEIMYQRF
ncbi:amidohydrolase [Halobacillus andaensis]|uniref:Amidohydrolase n=1 Tax=Halobacillus andaensis TaxID=1176239 RepID=A0A917AZN2_HALAA|nr:amidohydrolase [Halobacillus andaensis]MBP2002836.1 putative amidohydrolase YtcJ [Halobacillus andaensis]GGF06062.1 amidohydrolase [Halobacillus andaensis]